MSTKIEDVTATLTFIQRDPKWKFEKPYEKSYISQDVLPASNFVFDKLDVPVHDLRPFKGKFTLNNEGIEVFDMKSKLPYRDFFDPEKVKAVFAEEVRALICDKLGAKRLFIHECVVRKRAPQYPLVKDEDMGGDLNVNGQPVSLAHIDYTMRTIKEIIHEVCGDFAPGVLKNHIKAINIWKPLRGPLYDWPLAVCDARSIVPERDLIHTDTLYVDEVVESSSVLHHPQQKWYYLSGHMPDEILVFLGADSEIPGKGVPHCAFSHPNCPPDEAPRESIEFRSLAIF